MRKPRAKARGFFYRKHTIRNTAGLTDNRYFRESGNPDIARQRNPPAAPCMLAGLSIKLCGIWFAAFIPHAKTLPKSCALPATHGIVVFVFFVRHSRRDDSENHGGLFVARRLLVSRQDWWILQIVRKGG